MDNSFTVSNKEETFLISIAWQTDMNKDDKDKVHKILSQSLKILDILSEYCYQHFEGHTASIIH